MKANSKIKQFFIKIKGVSLKDFGHIFLFFFAFFPAKILAKKRPKMWLVCEYEKEARDNGYWLFHYLRTQQSDCDVVYAIDFNATDYARVKDLGECIPYGTLKHWIYYLAAQVNISSQKGGKPNAAVCYFLEVFGFLKNKRVFLQHGITKDISDMFFYENTKMRLFICGAKPEYEFISQNFHYPPGHVVYTGFSRFDDLISQTKKRQILVSPTWRRWLYVSTSNPYENSYQGIKDSTYYIKWKEFLQSDILDGMLEKYDYTLLLFPHRNMTQAFESMQVDTSRVRIVTFKDADLHELLKESSCMITDYSSTAMDFAYMKKPVFYYQFDKEEFREKHFEEGYYSYETMGFGPIANTLEDLLSYIEESLRCDCRLQEEYLNRQQMFFPKSDTRNCERIYHEIKKICE